MLLDNPLLTFLGRRGRGAIVEALRRNPGRTWTVRDLARFADVAPMVASRAVRELAALGAVETLRPGRDARVRLVPVSPAARFLTDLEVPDLAEASGRTFAAAVGRPAGVTWIGRWVDPRDDPSAPLGPVRIALIARQPEAALEAAGDALTAVRAAGLPVPELSAWTASQVRGDDEVAQAIRGGTRLGP